MSGGNYGTPEEQAKRLFRITMASIIIFSGLAYAFVLHGAL
jgi:hypothetical protein